MAVTTQVGTAIGSAGAVTSLVSASITYVLNGRVLVAVTLLDNTKSVLSITNSGTAATWALVAALDMNATLRIELWQCTNITAGAKTVTVNLSGSTSCAIAIEQYVGDVGTLATNETQSATDIHPFGMKAAVNQLDMLVFAIGFNGANTDTISADTGTKDQSAVGSAGAAGAALVRNGGGNAAGTVPGRALLSVSRDWGSIAIGLKGSSTTVTLPAFPTFNLASIMGTLPQTTADQTNPNKTILAGNSRPLAGQMWPRGSGRQGGA